MNNGEAFTVQIGAYVTNAPEVEVLPDMGPHKEVTMVIDDMQIYIDSPDTFYTVSEEIIDGVKTVTVNY